MIKITVNGADQVVELMKLIPNRMRLALLTAVRDSAIVIQSLAKKNAPIYRGLLRASIVQTVQTEGNKIIGQVGSALPYAKVVEFGRTAGWMPNIDQLRLWARRKLKDEHAGYAVGKAISRRGFRAQPYLEPAVEEAEPRVSLIFAARILEAVAHAGGA